MLTILRGLLALCLLSSPILATEVPPNLDRALEVQLNLARENPYDADIQNDLGNLLALDGRVDEAVSAYERALELDETKISARYNLALLLQHQGKDLSALRQFREVVDRDPKHAWAHYQAGVLYEKLGLESRAVKSFTKAFRLDRNLADPKVNPQIIRNPLHAHAMLLAYQEGFADPPQPPRTYDDPVRIAGLLVPEIKEDPAPPEVLEEDATKSLTEGSLEELSEPTGGPGEEEPGRDMAAGRVLNKDTLDDEGPANQATSAGTPASSARSNRGGQRTSIRGKTTPSTRDRGRGVPAIRLPEPPSKGGPGAGGGAVPGTPAQGGRGVRSTGQLEIDLVPVRAS